LGLSLLTFVLGLAIVGPANWVKWTAVFLVTTVVFGALTFFVGLLLPKEGVLAGIYWFGIVPLVPAAILGIANFIRNRSSFSRQEKSDPA
jgi:uncharacterized membrane protein